MDIWVATEEAYKNGYEKGYQDGKQNIVCCINCVNSSTEA